MTRVGHPCLLSGAQPAWDSVSRTKEEENCNIVVRTSKMYLKAAFARRETLYMSAASCSSAAFSEEIAPSSILPWT